MKLYVEKIIVPYVSKKREELKLDASYLALATFDNFTGKVTESILQLLGKNHIFGVTIPANCTDRLHPMDVSVNKATKNFLRQQFQDWYASKICEQLDGGGETVPIDLRLSVVKPLRARWMMKAIFQNEFKGAGITVLLIDPY